MQKPKSKSWFVLRRSNGSPCCCCCCCCFCFIGFLWFLVWPLDAFHLRVSSWLLLFFFCARFGDLFISFCASTANVRFDLFKMLIAALALDYRFEVTSLLWMLVRKEFQMLINIRQPKRPSSSQITFIHFNQLLNFFISFSKTSKFLASLRRYFYFKLKFTNHHPNRWRHQDFQFPLAKQKSIKIGEIK